MAEQHDVFIMGAGPTGLSCAIELQKLGVESVVADKGCLVNSIYHYPTNMTWFTTPELLEIGDLPMISNGDKPNRVESLKYYRRVADHYKLDVRQYEQVQCVGGSDGGFFIKTQDRRGRTHEYRARKVILASGFYDIPNRLNVPGEDLPKVMHYWHEAHPYWRQNVLVVGAKNSASIAALELVWYGAHVTLVHRGAGISDKVKYWIKPNIENRIKAGEVKAYFHSSVKEITWDTVVLDTPDGEVTLPNDWVFALVGYQPDTEFLNSLGIRIQPDTLKPISHPDSYESERPGIYLAGVIVAGMHTNEIFIENGRFHGIGIARDIAAKLEASC